MSSNNILPEKGNKFGATPDYIEVNLDSVGYTKKEQLKKKGETGRITNRICRVENRGEYTPDEFIELVTRQGHTFLLCTIIADENGNYTCQEANFGELNLLALDVDRGITWQEVLQDCLKKGLRPWLIYPSLGHTEEKPRFRVVFRLPAPVTDGRAAKALIAILREVFPYTDQNINSHTHRWYGGIQGPFYRNDENKLDLATLVNNFHAMVANRVREQAEAHQDPQKRKTALRNLARDIRNAAKNALDLAPVALDNSGAPVIRVSLGVEGADENMKDRAHVYRYYNIDGHDPSQLLSPEDFKEDNSPLRFEYPLTGAPFLLFQFTQSEEDFRNGKKPKKGNGSSKAMPRSLSCPERQRRDDNEYTFYRNWNENLARENCRRLDLALKGEDWLHHNELFHVWLHLIRVENGAATMERILNSRDGRPEVFCTEEKRFLDGGYDIEFKKQDFAPDGYFVAYFYHRDYNPCSCYKARCPYLETCQVKSIINAGRDTLAEIVPIAEDQASPLKEVRELLPPAIEHALYKARENISLIKGDTGVGKTFAYIEQMIRLAGEEEKRIFYVCPTHRLAREVHSNLKKRESNFRVFYFSDIEQHMPEDTRRGVLALYRVGAKKKAAGLKNEWLREVYQEVKDIPVENQTQKAQDIIDHWEARKIIEAKGEKNCIIVMTHARYRNTPGLSADVTFIDEDILTDHLVPVMDFHIGELEELHRAMNHYCIKGTDQIEAILEEIKNAPEDGIYGINSAYLYNSDDIIELVASGRVFGSRIQDEGTAVLDFLSGNTVAWGKSSYHGHQGRVYFVQRNELPDIKTVIASATLNRSLYSKLLGENMDWQELPMIAHEGRLIQYPQNGYSNTSLRESLRKGKMNLLEEFREKVGLQKCITTKEWKEALEENGYEHNIIGTFGAIEGLNEFEGQNLVIWSALQCPPIKYGLTAFALGHRTGLGDCFQKEKSPSPIERNNYRFPFRTYSDNELLQEIHLHLTETPLLQAVGRARLVEYPATVQVYSNFILPQAELR